MGIAVLGIDLGKTVCSPSGLDATDVIVYRKRLGRRRLLDFLEGLVPCDLLPLESSFMIYTALTLKPEIFRV
ncbi:hypothetical protein C7964_10744 [Loktanella sp. PT4BL]|uniref:hypothetical protein n=1 Tax=Loktanella sp. PT4BL TaxID=2135611 RepID=UPI000D993B96|nr:hypothetical protein [Loktanella sp. PT4BL]PXW67325.1 hypothetical protein C7964_10744 [Loktanella sp. PT4BL]